MRALRFSPPLELANDVPIPNREGESLVRVLAAGICNTDLEITRGYAGFAGTLGHEFVGEVVESSDSSLVGKRVVGEINVGCGQCELCRAGDSRHCGRRSVLGIKDRPGAFAEYLSLPERNLFVVPDSITNDEAVFIEPLAAGLRILEQVEITRHSKVAVVGDGKLAQLTIRVLAMTGCDLQAVGKHRVKLDLCRSGGAQPVPLSEIAAFDGSFDVIVECSGSPDGLGTALSLVKPTGTIVLKSTHHGVTPVALSGVVVNEIRIIGSRCGRFKRAIELLASGSLDVTPLIYEKFPLDQALQAFNVAAQPQALKVLIQMTV